MCLLSTGWQLQGLAGVSTASISAQAGCTSHSGGQPGLNACTILMLAAIRRAGVQHVTDITSYSVMHQTLSQARATDRFAQACTFYRSEEAVLVASESNGVENSLNGRDG